ncbi:polysaccharide biosynthesis tyrosine autokinase [Anaerosalibacter massiliensis]|uniref:polysaccharide biosynthesis tyrosine autokinase n=1 Tax=Anaerosalibacter massiliensis TaxID=1347392 RepID=UPI000679D836|nr:polysaccharide biosynthesis tyrosine autokinase [Anaerosalibacter massiliensis]
MDELTLRDFFSIISKRKWVIISVALIFSIIVGIITYFNTGPIYKTHTSLIAEEIKNNNDLDSDQRYLDQKFMNTYSEIVKSKLVIDDVKKNLKLDLSSKEISESIEVNIVPDTDIIKIEVTGKNPKLIADIANKVATISIKYIKNVADYKSIKIIDKAEVPKLQGNSFSKSNIINIIISGILGALISIAVIFLADHLDNTVKSPNHLEKYLDLPVVGVLKYTEEDLVMYKKPDSFTAENYRTVMTNIMSLKIAEEIKSISITSSNPNEDNSLVASNMAIAIAKAGEKVLLIDGNLREPMIHNYFNLENNYGLSNLLNRDINYKEAIREAKIEENLYVLTSGINTINPVELLASKQMNDFLEQMSKEYDFIIINSPSVGGITDSNILSTIADGTIIVCTVEKTDIDEVRASKELLNKLNANILGVILDKVRIEKNNYYKHYYDNYMYYEYGDKE